MNRLSPHRTSPFIPHPWGHALGLRFVAQREVTPTLAPVDTEPRFPPVLVYDDERVVGAIIRLDPDPRGGHLVINTLLEGRGQHTVLIALDARARARVLRVHHKPGTLVRCSGRLVYDGDVLRLAAPRGLELYPPVYSALDSMG